MRLLRQASLLLALTALATGAALALGAPNLGTSLGVGQVAFVLGLVWVLLRA